MIQRLFVLFSALCLPALALAQQGTVEYQVTLPGNSRPSTSLVYFSNGNVRTDMTVSIPGAGAPMKQSMLMRAENPNTIYMLNPANRTYSETTSSPGTAPTAGKATVKVIGKEKIRNLNTTHARVTFQQGSMDIWTTRDIPGYDKLLSYWRANKSFGGDILYSELKKAGADGFFVRMKNGNDRGGMTMELVRYDSKPVPASLFELPKDYKKGPSYEASGIRGLSPAQRKKMMDAIQKQKGN
ncbi:DUF4412 domain-containing protein [Larkinella soli]|uniref:DUF4412 domain-containing protein n=1 Tax=Larkinella soli TaxID=1770527 RepID=UPI0013E2D607|nr:DUF4412 domain-containing protein [Larkinella soli]